MVDPWHVHNRLTEIGVPGNGYDDLYARIALVADRLCLSPAGEPDTADLVGKINELCDRAGIVEGDPAGRVELLVQRCEVQATYLAELESDLKAERAQLAALEKPQRADPGPGEWSVQWKQPERVACDKLLTDFTSMLIRDGDAANEFLALARLAKRIRAALKEAD